MNMAGKQFCHSIMSLGHFHDTRHEAITRMVGVRKLPVEILAKITGHKKIDVLVNTYYNPNADDLIEAFNN